MEIEVRSLLFDRLLDRDPGEPSEPKALRTLDREGLLESIRGELERLFNTRCPLAPGQLEGRLRTTIDYGIPDPLSYSGENPNHHQTLGRLLEQSIAAYEPRLQEARVVVVKGPTTGSVSISVTALLVIDKAREPIQFPITVDDQGARVAAAA